MNKIDYHEATEMLIRNVTPIGICTVDVNNMQGRILAEDIIAEENVPYFAKSPYDGYAFYSGDTSGASKENPVTLKVIENIKAGQPARLEITENTAIRIMTGAPIPEGADAICKYEDTEFTETEVTLFRSYGPGENVITIGEDIRRGTVLAKAGTVIDIGIIGTAASLGLNELKVYKIPVAGIISTGDEIADLNEDLPFGKIRNSNSHTIAAALKNLGFCTKYLGRAKDDVNEIAALITKGEADCDIIISTGGVSVGDYDLVPDAMKLKGYNILAEGVIMKPGMACAYGIRDGKLLLALSGNPASALTNLQCVCAPALRKLTGLGKYRHKIIPMILKRDFKKGSNSIRFIRGMTDYEDGRVILNVSPDQGNIVISSAIGCNAYGMIPPGQAPVLSGETIEGFIV